MLTSSGTSAAEPLPIAGLVSRHSQEKYPVAHAASTTDKTFRWQDLAEQIGNYLHREGVPAAQAAQLSREVIRMCADAADSLSRDELRDDAMDEARTLLETWQVNRREQMLGAV
jgi:hypothetical protein